MIFFVNPFLPGSSMGYLFSLGEVKIYDFIIKFSIFYSRMFNISRIWSWCYSTILLWRNKFYFKNINFFIYINNIFQKFMHITKEKIKMKDKKIQSKVNFLSIVFSFIMKKIVFQSF